MNHKLHTKVRFCWKAADQLIYHLSVLTVTPQWRSPNIAYPFPAAGRRSGFTLIELLIVVGIIAILAAIALPNFLEAQTRSRVSRVRADMRNIALAIEAYAVENNHYPFCLGTFTPPLATRMAYLTTPVAFITSIPRDPFVRRTQTLFGLNSAEDPTGAVYLYNTGNNQIGPGNQDPATLQRTSWSLTSGGPDSEIQLPYWPFSETIVANNTHANFIYDPTNGTVSRGDIFLRGGNVPQAIPVIDFR